MSSDKSLNKNNNLNNKTLDTDSIQGFFVFIKYLYTNDFIMKKIIKLTERDLHKIVNESVKRLLIEQKFSIDPADLARKLFNNGDDFTLFVHWLEKEYSMLQAEGESYATDPKMELINAIKSSKTFYDSTGGFYGYESGDAELIKPIIIMGAKVHRIGYGIMDEKDMEECGDTEPIYFYGCSEQWDRSGEGRLTITKYVLNQIENIIKNIKK